MLGQQANNERLYMKKDWVRGLKSLREAYEKTRLDVGC